MKQHQGGFTLVELMVAMAIGTVIILGAGQLFLTTFQTFKTVDELSRKQESLIFIAQRVSSEIRQAGPGRYTLECEVAQVQEKEQCTCTVADTDEANQPLVSFPKDLPDSDMTQCEEETHALGEPIESNDDLYRVSLPIESNGEPIIFHVAQRTSLLESSDAAPGGTDNEGEDNEDGEEGEDGNDTNAPDPNNPGYYRNGDQMYNDRCYVPGNGNLNTNRNGCNAP